MAFHIELLPSGKLTVCYGKWPIEIDGFPIKNGDFPWLRIGPPKVSRMASRSSRHKMTVRYWPRTLCIAQ